MFIRWLGAFRYEDDLEGSIKFELSRPRQVAVEPLIKGRSFISRAMIGLVVDETKSQFVQGFIHDVWTEPTDEGVLLPTFKSRGFTRGIKNKDRYMGRVQRLKNNGHGEAVFDCITYHKIAVKTRSKSAVAIAQEMAKKFNMEVLYL